MVLHILERLVFLWVGVGVGIFLTGLLYMARSNTESPDGSVFVEKHPDGKIVYTLEIDDDPEQLQYKTEIRLRVVAEEADRD